MSTILNVKFGIVRGRVKAVSNKANYCCILAALFAAGYVFGGWVNL